MQQKFVIALGLNFGAPLTRALARTLV